jgi:hypothetical protein
MKDSKRHRLIKLNKIVNSLGKALPQEIMMRYKGEELEAGQDDLLRRNIYRDLKELADEGSIEAQYFLPEGKEISEDEADKFRNIRVYYCSKGGAENIPGYNLIVSAGGRIFNMQRDSLSWRVSEAINSDGMIWVSFYSPFSKLIHLGIPTTSLPATLLVTRFKHDVLPADLKRIEQRFGFKTAIFSCWDQNISRPNTTHRVCHCALQMRRDLSVNVIDDQSSTKTYFRYPQADEVREFLRAKEGSTGSIEKILVNKDEYEQIIDQKTLHLPAIVMAGKFDLLVHST